MSAPLSRLQDILATADVFTDGDWVESKDQDPDGDVRLVQLADIGIGEFIDKSSRFLTSAKARQLRCTFLQEGDVLVARMPDPIGRACIFPGGEKKSVTVVDVCVIRPDESLVDPRWLMHCLNMPDIRANVERMATGTTRSRISRSNLGKIFVPYPQIAEQRRIARVLDRVDALRARRRETIALLDDLAQAIFLDLFGDPVTNPNGWDRVPLGELLSGIDSGKSPQCLDRPARNDEWGVLKLGAVTQGIYMPSENKALPGSVEPDGRNEVRAGDLLFTRKNTPELVAAVAYVRETPEKLLLPDLIFRLVTHPDAAVDKVYLHSLLSYPPKRRKVQELATGSAASMPNISKAKLLDFSCELPPLELQERYASRIAKIEQLKTVHVEQLAELDALFNSTQHRAFRGEL